MFWIRHAGALRASSSAALEAVPFGHALSIASGNALLFWAPIRFAGGLLMRPSGSRCPALPTAAALVTLGVAIDWHSGSRMLYLDAASLMGWALTLVLHPAVRAAAQESAAPAPLPTARR